MHRTVGCVLDATIAGRADVVLSVAVATGPVSGGPVPGGPASGGPVVVDESLVATLDGVVVPTHEVRDEFGSRLHRAADLGPGELHVEYLAEVTGRAEPMPVDEIELIRSTRPSRYCESDRLAGLVRSEFAGMQGFALLDAVSQWVASHVAYVTGWSRHIDGAVATLLAGQGVCRDFAHLTAAALRACDTPARIVSVYAPGLAPMDFHAVVEAHVAGGWYVVDATGLAPRNAMLRIATGRDAADTAFLTVAGDTVSLNRVEVTAVTDGDLPVDDRLVPVVLA